MKNKRLIAIINIAVVLTILLLAEIYLRSNGTHPGMRVWEFREVKKFEYTDFTVCDEDGINRHPPHMKATKNDGIGTNTQGFRSNHDFRTDVADSVRNTEKKIIAFIGDSYTEGYDAKLFDSCFADIVGRGGNYFTPNLGEPHYKKEGFKSLI